MKKYKHAISSFYHAMAAKFWAYYGRIFKSPSAFDKAYHQLVTANVELLEFKIQATK